jgi:hypothetical protein
LNKKKIFSSTTTEMKTSGIFYNITIFPIKNEHITFLPNELDLSFDSFDNTIKSGQQRAEISMGGYNCAKEILKKKK